MGQLATRTTLPTSQSISGADDASSSSCLTPTESPRVPQKATSCKSLTKRLRPDQSMLLEDLHRSKSAELKPLITPIRVRGCNVTSSSIRTTLQVANKQGQGSEFAKHFFDNEHCRLLNMLQQLHATQTRFTKQLREFLLDLSLVAGTCRKMRLLQVQLAGFYEQWFPTIEILPIDS